MRRPRYAYLIVGGLIVAAILCMMLFAEQLTRLSPYYRDARTSILLGSPPFPPDAVHLLGTDGSGRDVWSRIVYGARWSMLFAFLIMSARLLAAVPAALLAAFGWKRIGWLVERLYVMTSAIPPLLIYLLVLAVPQLRTVGLWPSVMITVALLTLMEWPRIAVVLKGRVTSLMAEPFVEGAVAVGNSRWQLFKNHLFPHLWPLLLQMVAAEMSRALVVIAQLAIFGIMVGGGVINIVDDGRGGDRYVITSGVPEWGTLLGEGRYDVQSHPWIPFAPAAAFLLGIIGFSLISQGLETIVFSVQQIKEKTTARLSARWRWALPALVLAGGLWYFQGLPWTREAGIADLAQRQAVALTAQNLEAYAQTIGSDFPLAVEDLKRAADLRLKAGAQIVSVKPSDIRMSGSGATATWQVSYGFKDASPVEVKRKVHLVRRLGRWYEAGEGYQVIRGLYTDVASIYDPIDPTSSGISWRWNVHFLSTAVDHAYESVMHLFPEQPGAPRPMLKLYPSIAALRQVVGTALPEGAAIWYEPGKPIRMAPDYLRGSKRWEVERSLAMEMMKFLTETRLGESKVSPLTIGGWDLHVEKERDQYRIYTDKLVGNPFFTLDQLFDLPASQLSQQRQALFVTQAALLAEYAEARLPERPVVAGSAAALAAKLGTTPEALARDYYAYAVERVFSESLLMIPAAIQRIPIGLAEAVEARGAAFRPDGVTAYRTRLVDFSESKSGEYTVLVMEQATLTGERQSTGIVAQTWRWQGDGWALVKANSLVAVP